MKRNQLPKLMRKQMKRKRLTQKGIVEAMDKRGKKVTQQAVSYWLHGKRFPEVPEVLDTLLEVLNDGEGAQA